MTTKKQPKKRGRSARYQALSAKVEKNKVYSLAEAVTLVKETANVKFDAGIELHLHLGIDPKKGEQQVRGTITLPHGTGKQARVAAFVGQDKEKEAKEAGAELVGGVELIEKIKQTGQLEFDVAIATPEMMKELSKIAKILGPRNLMPSPKNETVTTNVAKTIDELKKGKLTFKNDDTANVHLLIGRASFSPEVLSANIIAMIEAIKTAKPTAAKGNYLKSMSLASTMGPGIKFSV